MKQEVEIPPLADRLYLRSHRHVQVSLFSQAWEHSTLSCSIGMTSVALAALSRSQPCGTPESMAVHLIVLGVGGEPDAHVSWPLPSWCVL